MALVDSHCPLQDDKFGEDREEVLERALGVLDWLVVIGDDMPSSRGAVDLCRDRVYAAVGIHPYYASTVNTESLDELRTMAALPNVVAIGEIGLDYFKYNDTPRDVQQAGFRDQLELAVELSLPVVIHNRESTEDLCVILDAYAPRLAGGVLHCFAGDTAFVERGLSWGFYISFAGNVTYPKAEALRTAVRAVPLERLLVETDSPYLAPQAARGKRCEPAYVRHTAEYLAPIKGIDAETLAATTASNAGRLFQIA
jgi:TatD DNase family protein